MPVTGLLLTLSADSTSANDARERIARRPEVEVGEVAERWLPIAADTPDVKAAHDFHEWLESLSGVEQVDVIHVAFEETSHTATAS